MNGWRSRLRRLAGRRPTHFSSAFTPAEWEELQLAPLWSFMVVGMSDGVVDDKERAEFLTYLAEASTFPLGLPRDVLVDLNDNLQALLHRFAAVSQTGNPRQALNAVASIVDRKAPRDEAVMYKVAVLDAGSAVAMASGRLFRKNVSKEERSRILTMQRWLRLDRANLVSIYEQYNKRERGPDTTDVARSRPGATQDGRHAPFAGDGEPSAALKEILEGPDTPAVATDGEGPTQQSAANRAKAAVAESARQASSQVTRLQRSLRDRRGRIGSKNTSKTMDSRIGRQVGQTVYRDMSIDEQWSQDHEVGFTWWAHRQAQRVGWAAVQPPGEEESAVVRSSTDIVTEIADVDEATEAANALNMSAGLSAIVVSEEGDKARLVSTVSVHSDTMHHARIFSLATAFQVAEAHELGDSIAQALRGRVDTSHHPLSGRRTNPDDMLNVLSDLPFRNEPVPLSEADFSAAAATVQLIGGDQLIAEANAQPHGLTIEFPFDHSIPATSLDPENPVSFLGTSLLTLSVLDDVADPHWRAVQDRHPGLAMLSRQTGAHTRYGSGLYVRLGLPMTLAHPTPATVAGRLNQLEADGASQNHLLGAWYGDDGIWFAAFYPNMLIASLPADQRIAMLTNIIFSQAARSGWAKDPVGEFVNAESVRLKTRKRKAARKPAVSSAQRRFRPSEVNAFARFRDAGYAPKITNCELGEVFEGDADNALPAGARIELWINCEATGRFHYPHVAVAFDAPGEISAIAAAETMPDGHGACYLGVFADGRHTNLGNAEDWRDPDIFFRAAIPVLTPTLG